MSGVMGLGLFWPNRRSWDRPADDERNLTDRLRDASGMLVETYPFPSILGGDDSGEVMRLVKQAASRADRIAFDLSGLDAGRVREQWVGSYYYPYTGNELRTVLSDERLRAKALFYRDGKPVPTEQVRREYDPTYTPESEESACEWSPAQVCRAA